MNHCVKSKSPLRLGKRACPGLLLFLSACTPEVSPQSPADNSTNNNSTSGAPNSATDSQELAASGQQSSSADHSPEPTKKTEPLSEIARELPASFDCFGLTCYRFKQAREALVPLILHHKAQLIAFGERHAPADYGGTTTVHRFQEEILPTIGGGASHLLVELMLPPRDGCQPEKEAANTEAKEITRGQSKNNQSEYLALGKKARSLGVVADILYPTCDDLKEIASPQGGVLAMMEIIAKLTTASLKEQLASRKKGRPLVLAYNGALHNDAVARQGRELWTFGPAMVKHTGGNYLEVDLLVPELIEDSDTWKSLPWYAAYQELDHQKDTILMKWGERSYALFFPPQPTE